jgi:hypothetical protein
VNRRTSKSIALIAALATLLAACQTAQVPEPEPTSTAFYAFTRSTTTTPSDLWFMDDFGVATRIGSTDVRLQYVKFNPADGLLYGSSNPTQGQCAPSDLVTIDTETGEVTSTVALSVDGARSAFTFLSDGTLVAFNNCWDGDSYNFETIDLETGAVTGVVASAIGWYSNGMWTDAEDRVWYINGNADVWEIDIEAGTETLVHTGSVWVPAINDVIDDDDFHLRGDRNPDTDEIWGVSPAYGHAIASAVVRASITADAATLIDVAPVQSAISIHGLAFPR